MTKSHDIAVVGIGCRFPKAPDLDAFWARLDQGKVAFSAVPAERWNHSACTTALPRAASRLWTRNSAC